MLVRRFLLLGLTAAADATLVHAQAPPPRSDSKNAAGGTAELELVERLMMARREYKKMLEQLRTHYLTNGHDPEKARWAEEELRQYHRIPKQAFRLELDVPPPTLHATVNIPEANSLFIRAMSYKGKGSGMDFIDNQRRAELLFQQLLTQYPQSTKIGDAAYQLGDIYEGKPYRQFRRAAAYFERSIEWNPTTNLDGRLRAARLYDRQNLERGKAIDLYKQIKEHETDKARIDEADKRLQALSGSR
jgi:tetratricopeptide (TPR) repeat protein